MPTVKLPAPSAAPADIGAPDISEPDTFGTDSATDDTYVGARTVGARTLGTVGVSTVGVSTLGVISPESAQARILRRGADSGRLTHLEEIPARRGRRAKWPAGVP